MDSLPDPPSFELPNVGTYHISWEQILAEGQKYSWEVNTSAEAMLEMIMEGPGGIPSVPELSQSVIHWPSFKILPMALWPILG